MKYKRITSNNNSYYRKQLPEYNMGGALSGAATGASLGTAIFPGIGTAIGAVGGAVVGYVASDSKERKQREQQQSILEANRKQQEKLFKINDQSILAQHDPYGTPNISYYPYGGIIDLKEGADYEVEGDEVVQGQASLESSTPIASDLQVAEGPTHDGGGVLGSGGERVFSDRSKVDNDIIELLSNLGIGKVKGNTYAEVAEDIGKKKGKYEKKIDSTFNPAKKTAEKVLPRIDASLDLLFEVQETEKEGENNMGSFKKGGKIEPYRRINALPDGGLLPPPNYGSNFIIPDYYRNPQIDALSGTVPPPTIQQTIASNNQITEGVSSPGYSLDTSLGQNPQGSAGSGFDWGSVIGQVGNLGNYITNRESISNLNTNVHRNLMPAPVYNYTDRSGAERNAVGRMIRTGQQALGTSSQTVNAANQAALMAQGLEANNRISQGENQRRDRYDMYYNDQMTRTNMANVGITNQASDMRRELENRKNVYYPQQARAAYMQGVMGNEAMRQQKKTDRERLLMSALLNDNNGVLTRAAEKFPEVEELLKKLGY